MTDSSDSGHGVCLTPSTMKEFRTESQFTEMRGWMVSLEDQYASVEESAWTEGETSMATDKLEEVEKMSPTHWPVCDRGFRFLHFFSGFCRMEDLEWWLLNLGEKTGLIIEVWSVDVAIDPSMDLCLLMACCIGCMPPWMIGCSMPSSSVSRLQRHGNRQRLAWRLTLGNNNKNNDNNKKCKKHRAGK
ncbi:unnamed protein product [Polarella glacialis]|uniref:Uncharacterized protein n=1 Tax=Polarella glacialis TaxID=89957 RepID=A0A813HSV2_POLGL|nr:unnamed protein product [Polarella glacialis]